MSNYLWPFSLFFGVSSVQPPPFSCPFPDDLLSSAIEIYDLRREYELSLYERYYVNSSDPGTIIFNEFGENPANNEELRKAGILINYQELIREALLENNGSCKPIVLSEFQISWEQYTECVPEKERCMSRKESCDSTEKWRTYDGICNNVDNWKWGAVKMEYGQLMKAKFDDGIHSIRRCVGSNEDLISPRIIGNIINSANQPSSNKKFQKNEIVQNVLAVMFSQILAHDAGHRGHAHMKGDAANGIRCCTKSYDKPLAQDQQNSQCLPIHVPKDDAFYSKYNMGCLNFIRAQTTVANDCKLKGVQKMNTASSHLDMHIVYSNDIDDVESMRNMTGGLFTMNANNVMPSFGPDGYKAGDGRVNQTPWLALWHSLLYRLHNHIALRLASVNKHWDDDKLFEEARRLNIAIYENLIYNQYLPTFLSRNYAESKNLTCRSEVAACGAYDASVDPSTIGESAHASYRLFHAFVPGKFNFIADDGTQLKTLNLSEVVNEPGLIENNYNDILRGMLYTPLKTGHLGYSKQVRNLFSINECGVGVDLFSIDVMRGRDFGVPPYIDFFGKCGLTVVISWDDLSKYFCKKNLQLLKSIYDDVADIDMLVGVLLEERVFGRHGVIGACVLSELFHRQKIGNRFFYTFPDSPYPFTADQINAINGVTFAHLLCWTTNLTSVPERSLEIPGKNNPLIDCACLPDFNMNPFKEMQ